MFGDQAKEVYTELKRTVMTPYAILEPTEKIILKNLL